MPPGSWGAGERADGNSIVCLGNNLTAEVPCEIGNPAYNILTKILQPFFPSTDAMTWRCAGGGATYAGR